MAGSLKITAKNQLTLKSEYLNHLGIALGEQVYVYKLPNGELKLKAKKDARPIVNLKDKLKEGNVVKLSVDEIDDVIKKGYAEAGMSGAKKKK